MFILRTPEIHNELPPRILSLGSTITIGNFDGVHLGHQALLELTRTRAKASGTVPVAITFAPHPLEVLTPHAPPQLTTPAVRVALLEREGMELVVLLAFSPAFASLSPEQFVRRVLLDGFHMRHLVLGYDFTLGKGRAGTPEVLAGLGKELGFAVEQLPALSVGAEVVSSTRIRELLRQGQVWDASALLGRGYSVRGEVIRGQDRGGKLLGFPTANLAPVETLLPKPGVYATLARIVESTEEASSVAPSSLNTPQTFLAVTNIGFNPTFGEGGLTVETHLLDMEADLYGKQLEVVFVERLRGEITFTGVEGLIEQIHRDIEAARALLVAAFAK